MIQRAACAARQDRAGNSVKENEARSVASGISTMTTMWGLQSIPEGKDKVDTGDRAQSMAGTTYDATGLHPMDPSVKDQQDPPSAVHGATQAIYPDASAGNDNGTKQDEAAGETGEDPEDAQRDQAAQAPQVNATILPPPNAFDLPSDTSETNTTFGDLVSMAGGSASSAGNTRFGEFDDPKNKGKARNEDDNETSFIELFEGDMPEFWHAEDH
uniref:Uncharacterized protein n=1 Tax=Odontella aurita TaxID=265563 RepID=A0A7S4MWE8_9STRA|mmetsp:Transcript_36722/g.110220  ORF Transcript_36722/g.110220 Transcript_36722/m.110220 type:complete len:214 (+) Transcript_36722:301-942(+)